MKIVLSHVVSSVTEFELELTSDNWKRIKFEIEAIQKNGSCSEVDVATQKKFLDSFEGNEELHSALYDILASNALGTEERYIDSSNESYYGELIA